MAVVRQFRDSWASQNDNHGSLHLIYFDPHNLFERTIPTVLKFDCLTLQLSSTATTTNTTKLSIKTFMEDHKHSYPCSVIACTRQGYHSKWLLATSRNLQDIRLRKEGYYVIKSNCLSHENVQNLIIAGDGIPLPVEFAEVVDALETWGGTHWTCWLQKSLKLMYEYMREDNMYGGVGPTKMRLFHDCILLAVQWKAGYKFYTKSPEYNLVLSNWNTYFWVRCRETYDFHELAYDSMNCVSEMIQSIDRDGPVTEAFQSVELRQLKMLFQNLLHRELHQTQPVFEASFTCQSSNLLLLCGIFLQNGPTSPSL